MKRTPEEWHKEAKALWSRALKAYITGEYTEAEYEASCAVHHFRMAVRAKEKEK